MIKTHHSSGQRRPDGADSPVSRAVPVGLHDRRYSEPHGQALPRSESTNASALVLTSSTIPASTRLGEGSRATRAAPLHGPYRTEISSPPPVFLTRHPPEEGSILKAVSSEPNTGSVRGDPRMSRVRTFISLAVSLTISQCHDPGRRPANGILTSVEFRLPIRQPPLASHQAPHRHPTVCFGGKVRNPKAATLKRS